MFSHGGVIMRPHRARLGDQMLSTLVYLKCNEHVAVYNMTLKRETEINFDYTLNSFHCELNSFDVFLVLTVLFVTHSHSIKKLCVSKVWPASQIRPARSVHPARGSSSVLTLNSAGKTYRTMSDCFHAEHDLVAH